MNTESKSDDFKKEALSIYEQEKKARSIAIPTSDNAVREMLRRIGEPRVLFGEDASLRRERLRRILATMDELPKFKQDSKKGRHISEDRYIEGTEKLKQARIRIAEFSILRAKQRLEDEQVLYSSENVTYVAERSLHSVMRSRKLDISASQIACRRPISAVKFNMKGDTLVTSSWAGIVKIWDVYSGEVIDSIRVCDIHIHDVDTYPAVKSYEKNGEDNSLFSAAVAGDGKCSLIGSSGKILGELNGHVDRANKIRFHPLGQFIGTTSMDNTFRFWDLETQTCLLAQEGHSYGVFGLEFHPDGSLAATGGIDSNVRIWDLRTGKNVLDFVGHISRCLTISASPNGVTLASGGEDNTIILWDLRKKGKIYQIPAHNGMVSTVKFIPGTGELLFSASYDGTVRSWQSADPLIPSLKKSWKLTKTLSGHDNKILSMDVSADMNIASASYDRTWKLWMEISG